jgi:hypothetical protein
MAAESRHAEAVRLMQDPDPRPMRRVRKGSAWLAGKPALPVGRPSKIGSARGRPVNLVPLIEQRWCVRLDARLDRQPCEAESIWQVGRPPRW